MGCYLKDITQSTIKNKKTLIIVVPEIPPSWNQFKTKSLYRYLAIEKKHKRTFGWHIKMAIVKLRKKKPIPFFDKPFKVTLFITVPDNSYDTNNFCEKYIIDMFNGACKNPIYVLYSDDRVANNPIVTKRAEIRQGIKQTIIMIEEI